MSKKKRSNLWPVLMAVILVVVLFAVVSIFSNRQTKDGDYFGEHQIQFRTVHDMQAFSQEEKLAYRCCEIMDYSQYMSYCGAYGLTQDYTDEDANYLVFSYYRKDASIRDAKLTDVDYNGAEATLYIWDYVWEWVPEDQWENAAYSVIVPTRRNVKAVKVEPGFLPGESVPIDDQPAPEKPILYLYPTVEKEVSVKLGYEDLITVSYPKYEDGWKVLAQPDGSLTDLETGRDLYALYYESVSPIDYRIEKEGFVVKGEDTISFLEEKLTLLGLTDREAEEFIVYWLPKLERNKYNYIRFATMEEIARTMPLDIQPAPDTTIRIMMAYRGLEQPIVVEEQKLKTPERHGFAAVEWGGIEIP